MRASRIQLLGLFALSLFGLALALIQAQPRPQPATRPRLAVLVVIDQFRGDYLARWASLFGQGGFKRLTEQGAWFENCHYPYANTLTGPGHATLATGCPPARHGIVGNDWYDRATHSLVNCVESPRYQQVPPRRTKSNKDRGVSPQRLLAPTLADALKDATNGAARVVALSLKDRSSVLPGGKKPDACYWTDADGRFVTSTYYRDRPHGWVRDFNVSGAADAWMGKSWDRLRPELDYERWSGPDDAPGKGKGTFQGRTFPHPFEGGAKKLKTDYYSALACSPMGNEVLLALVKRAVEEEKLGSHETPDLLCVSFSSNDLLGHAWGPDSQEVLDAVLRTDRAIAELLDFLDAKVGKGRYTLVLSADHGVCPLPEASRAAGRDARRIPPEPLLAEAQKHLDSAFPAGKETTGQPGQWVEKSVSNMLYLNRNLLTSRGVTRVSVEKELARWLAGQPGIQAAYTRTELLDGAKLDAVGESVRLSFHPDRSGDVMPVLKPYHLFANTVSAGTTHGTPHDYDTHVPLLVFGPGVRPGVRKERVSPELAAVVLARALGIDPPADARAPLPEKLFAPGGK